jgi:hypothetical protein
MLKPSTKANADNAPGNTAAGSTKRVARTIVTIRVLPNSAMAIDSKDIPKASMI